jgi:hypothetical protein
MRYLFAFIFILQGIFAWPETFSNDDPLKTPTILFTKAIETEPDHRDIGFDVLPVTGGAIISGSTSTKKEPVDGLLMKLTETGDVVWRKRFGGKGMDLIFSAQPDGTGGYICVGFKSPSGVMDMKAMDGWILRIDSNGNLTWEHTYGGPGEDRLTGIRKTAEGWMAVGHKETDGKINAWVLRVDQSGKEINSWTYDSQLPTKGLDVLPIEDGGFVFVGGEGETRETSDGFAIRIGPKGNQLWKVLISGEGFQVGYHLQQFPDSSFLVVGYGATNNNKDHQAYVMKIAQDGKVLYHQSFGGPQHDRATNALILKNNALIIAGQSQRAGTPDEDSGWDMIVYVLDDNGKPIWSGRFGGEGVEFGRAVKGDANNLWIVGHTTANQASNVLVIRMDVTSVFANL